MQAREAFSEMGREPLEFRRECLLGQIDGILEAFTDPGLLLLVDLRVQGFSHKTWIRIWGGGHWLLSSRAASWSRSRYVCMVFANRLRDVWGSSRKPASGNGSVTVRQ